MFLSKRKYGRLKFKVLFNESVPYTYTVTSNGQIQRLPCAYRWRYGLSAYENLIILTIWDV